MSAPVHEPSVWRGIRWILLFLLSAFALGILAALLDLWFFGEVQDGVFYEAVVVLLISRVLILEFAAGVAE